MFLADAPCPRAVAPMTIVLALSLSAFMTSGCAHDEEEQRPITPPPDPGELFLVDLESRLLRARTVHVEATLVAEGAHAANVHAELWLLDELDAADPSRAHHRARVDVHGSFDGAPLDGSLVSDGTSTTLLLDGRAPRTVPAPPELKDALVLGMVRMGLLHNVAMLHAGELPDHSDGGAHAWVKAERARADPDLAKRIAFDVVVRGHVAGDAIILLDGQARLVERRQRVRFGDGDDDVMRVIETYTAFEVDGELDPARFVTPPPTTP